MPWYGERITLSEIAASTSWRSRSLTIGSLIACAISFLSRPAWLAMSIVASRARSGASAGAKAGVGGGRRVPPGVEEGGEEGGEREPFRGRRVLVVHVIESACRGRG